MVREQIRGTITGFIEFIRERGVMGLAIGFVLGGAVSRITTSFSSDIVNPSLSYFFGSFDAWQDKLLDRFFVTHAPPNDLLILAIDDESIHTIGNWPWRRAVFADTLVRLSGARVIGIDVAFTESSLYGVVDDEALARALTALGSKVVIPVQFDDRGGKVTLPDPRFKNAPLAFVNVRLDSDGIVRTIATERGEYESFAKKISGVADTPEVFRINYLGPTKTIPSIPFVDVYQGKIPASVFKDKTIFIGVTTNDLHDIIGTPFGVMPGIEIHANAVATIQNGNYLKDVSRGLAFLLIFLAALLPYAAVQYIKRFSLLIAAFVVLVAATFLGAIIAFGSDVIIPVLYLVLAEVLSGGTLVALQYFTESKEKKFIRKTFSFYLMPEVIDEIIKDPEKLRLGGEKRKVTIFFSDIRGFTTISEKMSAEALTHFINEYLTAMTDIVMEHKGLVDKYIGDAVMAFWGAPIENKDQAKDACRAVLKMSAKLKELNKKWASEGVPAIGIGAGINTGDVVVGNMGSEKRFNYTIMGDEVNFGSRLEGLNKAYGTQCIVSESTAKEISGDSAFLLRELDLVTVKGKNEPKKIFELITEPVTDMVKKKLQHFADGRAAYIAGKWDEAIAHFKKALALGSDGPSTAFIERCEDLKAHPPPHWTGVYEFKTK